MTRHMFQTPFELLLDATEGDAENDIHSDERCDDLFLLVGGARETLSAQRENQLQNLLEYRMLLNTHSFPRNNLKLPVC